MPELTAAGRVLRNLEAAVEASLRGKTETVRLALVCVLARGHLLLEDVPGVGKTTLAQALARASGGSFHRIQFTSDLLPSDVIGVTVYNSRTASFEFKPGPLFANFLLADEINRTTPKTQSALLEAMNEQQVSVEGKSMPLPHPFMVIATQNPIGHQGTYPLPESQLDRFLMRLAIGYPDALSAREIIRRKDAGQAEATQQVVTLDELCEIQDAVQQVTVSEAIVDYMMAMIERTRQHEGLSLGVSPRGSQALYRAAQALALLEGRGYVVPDDVKLLAPKVLGHRIVPARRGFADVPGEQIITDLVAEITVPL